MSLGRFLLRAVANLNAPSSRREVQPVSTVPGEPSPININLVAPDGGVIQGNQNPIGELANTVRTAAGPVAGDMVLLRWGLGQGLLQPEEVEQIIVGAQEVQLQRQVARFATQHASSETGSSLTSSFRAGVQGWQNLRARRNLGR